MAQGSKLEEAKKMAQGLQQHQSTSPSQFSWLYLRRLVNQST
ncbi:hypothetical protein BVRB_7g179100 [Beta vulgaris subsp. vulgaris]|uniref:Uncharacterized protein n=1 Tax=Beta vulgaris subsp. vulgaris TaxID=3555 RepID=A0A0J8B736_BETVV|nr:hypothetical protein BVRB_7g179100 [Beta vulgaris subsp. vulgaris]